MSNGNYSPWGNIWKTDPIKEMDAFDKLPPKVRDALNDAPYEMSSEYAVKIGPKDFLAEYEGDCHKLKYRPIRRVR